MSWALIPLTEEQREIQRTARDFGKAEIAPHTDAWDRAEAYDDAIVGKLGELGFLGLMIPEQYDGLGLDTLTYLVALEEIAAVDASVAVMLSVHNSLPTQMILRWGTTEQKERFLRPMARGESLGAFALSEPEAGSDAASLRCQAVREGDRYVVSGRKIWISTAQVTNKILLLARTTPLEVVRKRTEGLSLFYVEPRVRRWQQVWVTARAREPGGLKEKRWLPTAEAGTVRFQGEIALPDGRLILDRTTLSQLDDGRVRQLIEISRDGGSTWRSTFDAAYRRQ